MQESLTYSEYLALGEILAAQRPRSEEHDEMLFIVVHQVYELWFKQMLHELRLLETRLGAGEAPGVLHTLRRLLAILKVAVAQVDVLETMTPQHFTGFRARLQAASGFQSAQFRLLEVALGRRDPSVMRPYGPQSAERVAIEEALGRPSVWERFLQFLGARGFGGDEIVDVLAAVYRADGAEAQVAERLVDLDEGFQEWRYRHVKMVERTIGDKPGTGGSSGSGYLRGTLFRPVFPALWEVRSRL